VGTLFKSLAWAGTRTALVPHNLRATFSRPLRYLAFTTATCSAAIATSAMLQNSVLKFQQLSTSRIQIMVVAAKYLLVTWWIITIEPAAVTSVGGSE
jgi:hypothetical protein